MRKCLSYGSNVPIRKTSLKIKLSSSSRDNMTESGMVASLISYTVVGPHVPYVQLDF